jgi:hypothetical protein
VARFVLLHGAWHGGWSFDPLAAELERRGHQVEAPELPCDQPGLTQDDYARVVGPQPDAVVVAHSLGGLTAALVPARLRVFVAALLPVENVYARALEPDFHGTVRDGLGRWHWPDADTAAEQLYPDCPRAVADASFARLRPQAPLPPRAHPVDGANAYVVCLRDRVVRPAWQDSAARTVLGVEPRHLDAGHFAVLTHARELAGLLHEAA